VGTRPSSGLGCDVRRVPHPEVHTASADHEHIDTAWELIKRAQHSLDDARGGGYVNRAGGDE